MEKNWLFDTTDKEFSIFMDIYGHLNLSFLTPSATQKKKRKKKKELTKLQSKSPFPSFQFSCISGKISERVLRNETNNIFHHQKNNLDHECIFITLSG